MKKNDKLEDVFYKAVEMVNGFTYIGKKSNKGSEPFTIEEVIQIPTVSSVYNRAQHVINFLDVKQQYAKLYKMARNSKNGKDAYQERMVFNYPEHIINSITIGINL